ncbi:MAG: pilus assembly FimT family protein [Candidatus Poribacteria bacterium]
MKRFIKRSSDGFTLIEVTIVIFIILLMTTTSVPWMKTFAESTRLRSTARSIRSLLEFARTSAITERSEYVVLFDPTNSEYWLSLKELLDETSGGSVTDQSRTNLTAALESIAEREAEELASEQSNSQNTTQSNTQSNTQNNTRDQENQTNVTRTGGLLGIPNRIPAGIQIVQINSPRSSNANSGIQYVTFYPDSRAEEFEVYLQSQSGKMLLITVSQSTGRTGIRELTEEDIQELGLNINNQ